MSLVGPRPCMPEELKHYCAHDVTRLFVVPGVTGPWQVERTQRDSGLQSVVRLEREYIESWSIVKDVEILARTIPARLPARRVLDTSNDTTHDRMAFWKALSWSGANSVLRIVLGFFSAKVSACYLGPSGMALVGEISNFLQVSNGSVANGAQTGVVNLTAERDRDGRAAPSAVGNGDVVGSGPEWTRRPHRPVECLTVELVDSVRREVLARRLSWERSSSCSRWSIRF